MRITRNESSRPCAICGRRMLMGEQFNRFSPAGDDELVEVCRLCYEKAVDHGWSKEGAPTTPTHGEVRRPRHRILRFIHTSSFRSIFIQILAVVRAS